MSDPSLLLGTISQSSAAIVAIIGGFLVSRLVAISSEREGIKRQLKAARQEEARLRNEWEPVHQYRLNNSISTMEHWLEEDLIDERERTKDLPIEEVLNGRIPRGSSLDELAPYAEAFRERVAGAFGAVRERVRDGDDRSLDLDELTTRGLEVPEEDADLYTSVVHAVRRQLPRRRTNALGVGMPNLDQIGSISIPSASSHQIEMRRLDESIREESQLRSQLGAAEQAVERLDQDLKVFAQPIGVTSAIVILALFSLLGIVLPLTVMSFGPAYLDGWTVAGLLGCFVVGLGAVLVYIAWYFRKIRH